MKRPINTSLMQKIILIISVRMYCFTSSFRTRKCMASSLRTMLKSFRQEILFVMSMEMNLNQLVLLEICLKMQLLSKPILLQICGTYKYGSKRHTHQPCWIVERSKVYFHKNSFSLCVARIRLKNVPRSTSWRMAIGLYLTDK